MNKESQIDPLNFYELSRSGSKSFAGPIPFQIGKGHFITERTENYGTQRRYIPQLGEVCWIALLKGDSKRYMLGEIIPFSKTIDKFDIESLSYTDYRWLRAQFMGEMEYTEYSNILLETTIENCWIACEVSESVSSDFYVSISWLLARLKDDYNKKWDKEIIVKNKEGYDMLL